MFPGLRRATDRIGSGTIEAARIARRRALAHPLVVAFLVVLIVADVGFAGLCFYTLYRVRLEVGLLQLAVEAHVKERQVKDEAWRAEFDNIYRTLYAPPEKTSAPSPRKPSYVETWQVNRDKELRDRITALERWRQRTER